MKRTTLPPVRGRRAREGAPPPHGKTPPMKRARAPKAATSARALLPVLCGADIELGNFILGRANPSDTSEEASQLLLAAMDGVADRERFSSACNCPACRKRREAEEEEDGSDT
mgnify:CR=1 FL=1